MSTLSRPRRNGRLLAHAVLAIATALSMLAVAGVSTAPSASAAVVPPVVGPDDGHVTADELPTVQVDGVVWDQVVVGNTVYVVGDFDNARPAGSPPGTNQTPRSNMLAFNITTGALIPGFVANLNSQGKTVTASPDGSRIYIGGQFTSVNGVSRPRIAALDPATGAVITAFNAGTDYIVNDLTVTNTTVYAGGPFNAAKGQPRSKLAAFAASNGSLLDWAPSADATVQTILLSPDGSRVLVGGHFFNISGSSAYGMGALDPVTGAVLPWAANQLIRNGGPDGAILDLSTDGTSIFGNGYTFGRASGNLEGVFKADATTGEIEWIEDCHGDTYAAFPMNGYVYKAGHFHFCGNVGGTPQTDNAITQWGEYMRHAMSVKDEVAGTIRRDNWNYHNLEGQPAPSTSSWSPNWQIGSFTGQSQATWAVDGNSQYVTYGGEFTRVNSTNQQGLVRFAVRPIAPRNEGPRLTGTSFPINVVSPAAGQVRVSFPANFDRDDRTLTYQIQRNGVTVHTTSADSTHWDQPTVSFLESGLTPGSTPSYRVRASDPDGNAQFSSTVPVTVATSGAPTPYANKVIDDGARIYWRLGETPGSATAADSAGIETGAVNDMTFGQPGAILGDTDTAISPNSTSSRIVQPPLVNAQGLDERNPVVDELSVETWFRTTSGSGGHLLGFGNSSSGSSSSSAHDRMLYVSNAGRVLFGVRTRAEGSGVTSSRVNRTIQSSTGLNDGQWHHVVGTLSPDGMKLYVDGVQVSSRTDVNSGHGYYGYWRVGADAISSSWSSAPSSSRLNGDIDEAAVYHDALTTAQVSSHWVLSGRAGNQAPTAAFDWSSEGLTAAFDASASGDVDGNIVSYAWTFGDSSNGTGVSPQRTYASAGAYTVTLTVTDDDGATGQISKVVNVTAPVPNVAPQASFSAATVDLAATVDASASVDSDGSIVSYAWDFGDGAVGSGVTAGHTYAAAGAYTVTLTVTDDDGATDDATEIVNVTDPPANVPPVASFSAVASGLDVAVNGSASTDADGSITSYAWDFGDGGAGSGASAGHTYAAAGAYTVTLTVTDDDGATDDATQIVNVTEPAPGTVFAADAFERSEANGLGTADIGGAWTTTGASSRYSVSGGGGNHAMVGAGHTTSSFLDGAAAGDVAAVVDVSFDKTPTGAGTYSSLVLRRNGNSDYRARVRVLPTSTTITLFRVVNGAQTTVAAVNVPGLAYDSGDVFRIEFEAVGSSPTQLSAKVWQVGETEPVDWQVTFTDATAAMQAPGGVGLVSYLSGSSTNAPVTARYDDLRAATPGSDPGAGNAAPVALFSVASEDLSVSVDGSASTDDGAIISHEWDFGDGATGSGITAAHTYAAPGTYTVSLVVTDDEGAVGTSSQPVTVSVPGAETEVALDLFDRTVSNGWGTAPLGGAWTSTGPAASYSVDGGLGRMTVAAGVNRSVTLAGLSLANIDTTVDFSLDQAPTGGGMYLSSVVRKVGTSEYRLRVRFEPSSTTVQLMRVVNGAQTVLTAAPLPGVVYTPGTVVHLRFRATGSGTTALAGKVWFGGDAEPGTWTIQTTDAAAELQGAGGIGVHGYQSGSSTGALAVLVDRIRAIVAEGP